MKTILFIVIGLMPAVVLRYVVLRKAISRAATVGTCFGIAVFVAIVVSTSVEKKFQQPASDEIIGGPLPILSDFVSQMFYAGVPVLIGSYFILRRGANGGNE